MIDITHFDQIQEVADTEKLLLFYAKSPLCIVCQDTAPLVDSLAKELDIPVYAIDVDEMGMARGQMNLYTAPVILIYYEGKEVHRQGRFIDLEQIREIVTAYQEVERNHDQ